jgi:NADPH-dependent ferric siderophore reductase
MMVDVSEPSVDPTNTDVPSPPGGDRSDADYLANMPEVRQLRLRVLEITEIGAATRAIRLGGEDLDGFGYAPGQDLMILADMSGGRIIRRRYTIRRLDTRERYADIHVVTDSTGPGARWASALRTGDPVEAIGPRGKITNATGVDWHLYLGDEVAVPAMAAMVEALPAGTRAMVYAEIADAHDETKIDPASALELTWRWLHRDGRPAGEADALCQAARQVALPPGTGHAYVFGEAAVVATVRDVLRERGLTDERMSVKAYWGRGRANASHGEPLKSK